MIRFTCVVLVAGLLIPQIAYARPVSYPDGWTVMQRNNGDRSSLHFHYSPTATDSIGIYSENNWEDDVRFIGLQYNRLVKRWNAPNSQGNLYAKFGVGQADPYGPEGAKLAGFTEVSADWETRRWFTEYRLRATDFGDNETVQHIGRLGVAPYVGDYGDLHTWFMVQVENRPEADKPVITTPLIRFFKGVQMVELGYTIEQKEWLANWIVRF